MYQNVWHTTIIVLRRKLIAITSLLGKKMKYVQSMTLAFAIRKQKKNRKYKPKQENQRKQQISVQKLMKWRTKEYYEKVYAYKYENLGETDKFLKRHKLSKHTQKKRT